MVPLEQADAVITSRIFMTSIEPYQTRKWVKGENWDAQIADIVESLHKLDPTRDGYDEKHAALVAQLREYQRKNDEEAIAGGWEYTDTGMTVGEHFDRLDPEGKREYLKTRDICVEKVTNPPLEPGASRGIRVIIDGQEPVIFPYPPKMHA